MSVINQVLSQLEQRGVPGSMEEVRPVPVIRSKPAVPWVMVSVIALGICVLLGLGISWWLTHRSPQVKPISYSTLPANVAMPAALPSAVVAATLPSAPMAVSAIINPNFIPLSPQSVAPKPVVAKQATVVTPVVVAAKPIEIEKPLPAEKPAAKPNKPFATTAPRPPHLAAQPAITPISEVSSAARSPAPLPVKQVSVSQQVDAEFQKALAAIQQGHLSDALAGLETVLGLDPNHDTARQTLVALLLENKLSADAERVLQDGIRRKPNHTGFAMMLARLQIERGGLPDAVATLEKSLPYAETQADYQAFLAALLQRQARHADAISHYQIALQHSPGNGIWLMGLGISLQAAQRPAEAKNAFQRALDSQTLNAELKTFVQQRMLVL